MRMRFGILNADGSVSGNLHVSGDDRKTTIEGALFVSDCRITLGKVVDTKFVPEESPTYANVTVATGKRVDFNWPSEELPVVRTSASPGGRVAITYRGDTGAYTVKGGIGVQGGEIYYFDRSFIMKKGSLRFNEDQTTFDPWITAHAEVREWDPSTSSEVRIYLDADSPFSKFSPRFSSDPPRADADILAMIGAPLMNRAETQGIGVTAGLVYSDILSQSWILHPFEQKVRQVLNLDMFSVRTQIIQNLVAQKVLGTTLNPLDNTSVSLGKYLGNDLLLEMLVRLQQPQVPVAVVTPGGGLIAASTGLQPDFELSLEWATPFFLLNWSFLPKHPETLFLSDNSLSFSWRITY
jgi:translocation and assembly module TamB